MDDKTRDVLDELFAFKIGELVYFRTAAGGVLGREHPSMYQITERRLQQCPGGIQQTYCIDGRWCAEIELTVDLPIGRKLTGAEAEGIRSYRKMTATASWSDMIPETKKATDKGDGKDVVSGVPDQS